jgi:hypothetical protein
LAEVEDSAETIENAGFEVIQAGNADEAVAIPPDPIFTLSSLTFNAGFE